jgi:hypothetical protein
MGTLYVDPKTLPAGPFLAYDRNGKLVSTIYMIPLKDFDGQKKFDDLLAPGGNVDHVSMYYNVLQCRPSGCGRAPLPHCALARDEGAGAARGEVTCSHVGLSSPPAAVSS